MNALFTQLLRQSLTGGWMILVLVLLRPLVKRLPRWISCLLWALAALRLAVPFSLESKMSLVPQQIIATAPHTYVPTLVTPIPQAQAAAQAFSWQQLLPVLWLAGVAAMGLYALVSCIRILRRVQVSIRLGKGLYLCDEVRSPFILGVFRPRIYLPSDLKQPTLDYVLSHERAHLRRGDHLWKPLGYALLSVYWFNPLCWLAYILFCRDIEQACDEAVIKNMSPGDKKAYSAALLQCSLPGHAIAACPLAFGEVGVKQRIRGILNYRKPRFWVMVLSIGLCAALSVSLLTDPVEAAQAEPEEAQGITIYSAPGQGAQAVRQLDSDEDYTLVREEPIGTDVWGYIECQDGTKGWITLAESEEQPQLPEIQVYSSPSQDAHELYRLAPGEDYTILERKAIGNRIWGYVECNSGMTRGWMALVEGPASHTFLSGTVTADRVNVRSGPGASNTVVGYLEKGAEVIILEVAAWDDQQWGYLGPDSWVNMNYIQCQEDGRAPEAAPNTSPNALQPTIFEGTGEQRSFTRQTAILSAPSSESREVARAEAGEAYYLLRVEPIAGTVWGYVEYKDGTILGWILLEESEAVPQLPEIRVYSSPSQDARELCRLAPGEDYTIQERETIGNTEWAYIRCRDGMTLGWIALADTSNVIATGTVSGPENLNIRSGPGTIYPALGFLEAGQAVNIYEIVTSGDLEWGRISDSGWVCLRYIDYGASASADSEITYYNGPTEPAERYTFSQKTDVCSSPSGQAGVIGQAAAGETGIITRREFIGNGSWAYLTCQDSGIQGWVHLTEEDEALNYFREYVEACGQPRTDLVEQYLYFSSDYAREFFRMMYSPVTGWYPSGIFRVNDNLWGIEYSDSNSGRMVYSFVGRMDGRLYVFQNVHQVPEALSENLEVSRYEEENAMYVSEGYMESDYIIRRLLPFAQAKWVTIAGLRDYSDATPCPVEDVICGTDTWREVEEPGSSGEPGCTLWLFTADGSVACISDSSPVVAVSDPDGTRQYFQAAYTGQELVGYLYQWAKSLADGPAPGEMGQVQQ